VYDLLESGANGRVDVATLNHFKAKIINIRAQRARVAMIGVEMADLVSGEQPTLYQSVKKHKRRTASVDQAIRDENGIEHQTQSSIAAAFVQHFQKLYAPLGADVECTEVMIEQIDERLTAELDLELMAPFTSDELRVAIRAGGMHRAPGLDSLGVGFYRATKELIRDDMVGICNAMFFEGITTPQQKRGILVGYQRSN
jgi:hypothetical protein